MAYDKDEIQRAFRHAADPLNVNHNYFAHGRKGWASIDTGTVERVALLIADHLRGNTHPAYAAYFSGVVDQTDRRSLAPNYTPDPFRHNLPQDNVLVEGAAYRVLGALLELRDERDRQTQIKTENQRLLRLVEHLEATVYALRSDVRTLLIMFEGKQEEVDRLTDQLEAIGVLLANQKRTDKLDKSTIASIANTAGLLLNTAIMGFTLSAGSPPPFEVIQVQEAAQSVVVYCGEEVVKSPTAD